MTRVLDEIVASKRREVHGLRHRTCYTRVAAGPRGGVVAKLTRASRSTPLRLIAENKRKSPSAGALSAALTPAARALRYAESGASMISVLCDEPFFGGSWDDVVDVRNALDAGGFTTPVLAKEFVLDERQLREANACGADAALLIVRILEQPALVDLVAQARTLGLEPLVEVATEEELARALEAGATLVGVNARDLDTLVMDADRAARVLAAIPAGCVPIHLSGLKGPDDVRRIAKTSAHAALVGETLMREDDPGPLLRAMVAAAESSPE
jgi:indole-3-glycerol phosphate synthase